ncbi:hypothetical protein FQR65_LT09074 [Abscondita terminalis]|nr:hypothetical protein FQR65_LT09074 [Abscondita terminalis]
MADLSDSASDTGSRDGGGKDSGCEVSPDVTEPPFTHLLMNSQIKSFKRVKHLTKDWRVVAHALTRSTKLEINDAGSKLRRKDPLPQYDETTPSRTIVAVHMPIEKVTIENVAELFKSCGEIALTIHQQEPSLNGLVCALVEFVFSESARKAIKLQELYGENMKVYELNGVPHIERKKKNNSKINKIIKINHDLPEYSTNSSCPSSSEAEDLRLKLDPRARIRRGSSINYPSKCTEPAAWLQRRLSASSTEAHFMYMHRRMSNSSRDSSDSNLFILGSLARAAASVAWMVLIVSLIDGCHLAVNRPRVVQPDRENMAENEDLGLGSEEHLDALDENGVNDETLLNDTDGDGGGGDDPELEAIKARVRKWKKKLKN